MIKNDKTIDGVDISLEKYIGRKLENSELIHHIDGDKHNNVITNLVICNGDGEHRSIHASLEKVAFNLIKKEVIQFNHELKLYYINPLIEVSILPKSLSFDDIAIKQKKNKCNSRLDVNIESEIIKGFKRSIPLIASNMSTVVNSDFIIKLYKLGAFGIMHRADSEENILSEIKKISKECEFVGASIGVGNNQYEFTQRLIESGANISLSILLMDTPILLLN